jgi:hypothetical protein
VIDSSLVRRRGSSWGRLFDCDVGHPPNWYKTLYQRNILTMIYTIEKELKSFKMAAVHRATKNLMLQKENSLRKNSTFRALAVVKTLARNDDLATTSTWSTTTSRLGSKAAIVLHPTTSSVAGDALHHPSDETATTFSSRSGMKRSSHDQAIHCVAHDLDEIHMLNTIISSTSSKAKKSRLVADQQGTMRKQHAFMACLTMPPRKCSAPAAANRTADPGTMVGHKRKVQAITKTKTIPLHKRPQQKKPNTTKVLPHPSNIYAGQTNPPHMDPNKLLTSRELKATWAEYYQESRRLREVEALEVFGISTMKINTRNSIFLRDFYSFLCWFKESALNSQWAMENQVVPTEGWQTYVSRSILILHIKRTRTSYLLGATMYQRPSTQTWLEQQRGNPHVEGLPYTISCKAMMEFTDKPCLGTVRRKWAHWNTDVPNNFVGTIFTYMIQKLIHTRRQGKLYRFTSIAYFEDLLAHGPVNGRDLEVVTVLVEGTPNWLVVKPTFCTQYWSGA